MRLREKQGDDGRKSLESDEHEVGRAGDRSGTLGSDVKTKVDRSSCKSEKVGKLSVDAEIDR